MENLDAREACFAVDEDLLNFTLEDEQPLLGGGGAAAVSGSSSTLEPETTPSSCVTQTGSVHDEPMEEELEWLSNKDAFPEVETCLFPAVETCFGILADNPELIPNHLSPISVLEHSGSSSTNIIRNTNVGSVSCFDSYRVPTKYPVRARGKRCRKKSGFGVMRFMPSQQFLWSIQDTMNKKLESLPKMVTAGLGRRCMHCQTDKTPQWRAGPNGPKTLCNACGVRYKSGRLVPEYRPASSPTFSSVLHSNSHRKVVEMRRQKQAVVAGGGGGVGTMVVPGGGAMVITGGSGGVGTMVGPNVAAPGSGGCTVV